MPQVTKQTVPQCRRFTYPAFTFVQNTIPTASTPKLTAGFTLRPRVNGRGHRQTFSTLTETFNEWLKGCKNTSKSLTKIIDEYRRVTSESPPYKSFFKEKKWVFGSDAVETKAIKKIYMTTHKSLITLCENVLYVNNSNTNDDDDEDDDFIPRRRRKRSSISVPDTPSIAQTPTISLQSRLATPITCNTLATRGGNSNTSETTIQYDATNMPHTITIPDSSNNVITYFNTNMMESMIQNSMKQIATEIQKHQNMVKQQLDAMREELLSQMESDKQTLRVCITKQIRNMRPKRSRRKKSPERCTRNTLNRRRRRYQRRLSEDLDETGLAAITNYTGNINDNVAAAIANGDDALARNIRRVYREKMEAVKDTKMEQYRQCFMMIKQGSSRNKQTQFRLLMTKESEYQVNADGNSHLKRRHKSHPNAIDQFAMAAKFRGVFGNVLDMNKYRKTSFFNRHIVTTDGKDELTLILYKSLEGTSEELFHRLLTHPAFIGATTQPHYLYHRKYFDGLIGKDNESSDHSLCGDHMPNLDDFTEIKRDNGDVIMQCSKLQLMSLGQDAKGGVANLPTKKLYHGSIVPMSMMRPGAIQLSTNNVCV